MYIDEEYEEDIENWNDMNEDYNTFVRGDGIMNGASSLGEAAAILRAYADWLEEKEFQGWRLRSPIEEDYGDVYQVDINGSEVIGASFE
jgi:hypothetical protein